MSTILLIVLVWWKYGCVHGLMAWAAAGVVIDVGNAVITGINVLAAQQKQIIEVQRRILGEGK